MRARTYCKAREAVVGRAQAEKIGESECVAWYQFVWRGSRFGRPDRRSLCASAAIRHSIKPNNIRRDRFILSVGCVRYQLPLWQRARAARARMEIESANNVLRRPATRLMTPD